MKKMYNKALSLALTLIMVFGILAAGVLPAGAYTVPQSIVVHSENKPVIISAGEGKDWITRPEFGLYWCTPQPKVWDTYAFIIDLGGVKTFNVTELTVLYSSTWLCAIPSYRIYGTNTYGGAWADYTGDFNANNNGWTEIVGRQGNYNEQDTVILNNPASYRYIMFQAIIDECRITKLKIIEKENITEEDIDVKGLPASPVPVGARQTLTGIVQPENSDNKNVEWHTTTPNIIEIDENGSWTALKEGKASVTATSSGAGKVSRSWSFDVYNVIPSDIVITNKPIKIDKGYTGTLKTEFTPHNTTDKSIIWTASDNTVIDINKNTGVYTAVGAGSAIITAKTINNITDNYIITVQNVPEQTEAVEWTQPLPAPKYGTGYPGTNPVMPDSFTKFNPLLTDMVPLAGAPVIYEHTKTAAAGESVSIMGEYFTPDTRFIVYYQTASNEGKYFDAKIQLIDGSRQAVITLPESSDGLNTFNMYMIWAINNKGAGYPMIINKADGWWIGPANVAQGDTAAAYGTNYTKSNQKENDFTFIYLQDVNGDNHIWLQADEYNPNRVGFTVPENFPAGSYYVYIHNGNGGEYGFAYSGVLNVAAPKPWTNNIINVKNHGAVGDGISDDTAAIRAAISVAGTDWNTLYFPAGNYVIKEGIYLNSNTKYTGDGILESVIAGHGNLNHMIYLNNYSGDNKGNIEIHDMSFNSENIPVLNDYMYSDNPYNRGILSISGVQNSLFKNMGIICPRGGAAFPLFENQGFNNVVFDGCTIQSVGITLSTHYTQFRNCLFIGRSDTEEMIHSWASSNLAFENCTYRDFNQKNDGINYDFAQRFFVENNSWGGANNLYFGGNNLEKINPHKNSWMAGNAGEIILFESSIGKKLGTPVTVGKDYFTIKTNLDIDWVPWLFWWTGEVYITQGTGAGQRRHIINGAEWDANIANKTVKLDREWDIMPDSTSQMTITSGIRNVAIRDNLLEGETDYDRPSASTGVNIFCAAHDVVVSNNIISNVRSGLTMYGAWSREVNPNNFETFKGLGILRNVLYTDNEIYSCYNGFLYITHDFDSASAYELERQMTNGVNIFRNNLVSNITETAIATGGNYCDNSNTVYENNTFDDARVAIGIDAAAGDTHRQWKSLYYKNTFNRRYADFDSSVCMNLIAESGKVDINLRDNVFNDYKNTFTGHSTISSKLEIPYRYFTIDSKSNTGLGAYIDIWNSGIGEMQWTAATDTPWLELKNSSGVVDGQSDSDRLEIACNMSLAQSDRTPGYIDITANDRTIRIQVKFDFFKIEDINISSLPEKIEFFLSENINLDGAKINVEYADGFEQIVDITDDMISGYNKNRLGTQTITVAYEGRGTSFNVSVVPDAIKNIIISSSIEKTMYIIGEELDLTGGKISLIYESGKSYEMDMQDYLISGFNKNKAGEQQLTITYQGKKAVFSVVVLAGIVKNIELESAPATTEYFQDEDINISGGKIKIIYEDDTFDIINITDNMLSGYNKSKIGGQSVKVTFLGMDTSFNVTVKQNNVSGIVISSLPAKNEYLIGELLNLEGGIITVTYLNGITEELEITRFMLGVYDVFIEGEKTITVKYAGFSDTFTVTYSIKITIVERKKGFITNNGKNDDISITDAIEIFRHLAGKKTLTGDDAVAADIDGKGGIAVQDAIYIFRYLAGKLTMNELQELHKI